MQVPIGSPIVLDDDFEVKKLWNEVYILKGGAKGVVGEDGNIHLYNGREIDLNLAKALNNYECDAKGIAEYIYERLLNSTQTKDMFEKYDSKDRWLIIKSISDSLCEIGFDKLI